jgi:hypothetical protein
MLDDDDYHHNNVDGVRLRLPTGLFTLQVIYEHGEPWWNDIGRVKLIRSLELSGSPTSKAGGTGLRKRWILSTKYLFHTRRVL